MGENSSISWTDDTFSPWIGCTKVSPACDGCYAENLMATRYGRVQWGAPGQGEGTRQRTSASNWAKPLKWEREQAALWAAHDVEMSEWNMAGIGEHPIPPPPSARFVFCASLADVLDPAVPIQWLADLIGLVAKTPHLTYLFLSKRIGLAIKRIREALALLGLTEMPRNIALGATVVTQEEADRDIPKLLAAFRTLNPPFVFISDEPSQGLIRLPPEFLALGPRAWAIWGGETDQGKHRARWADPDWARVMRDDCLPAGVPFHLKQMTRKAPVPEDLQIQERPNVHS